MLITDPDLFGKRLGTVMHLLSNGERSEVFTCCFISNYLSHHQLPFCLEMMRVTNGGFTFVETSGVSEERRRLGYEILGDRYDFVVSTQKGEQYVKRAMRLADEADVVIIGSAPDTYIRARMRRNALTFRYSERIFKKGENDILRRIKYTLKCLPYRKKKMFYLLASAYAPRDYRRCTVDPRKMLKWGYFPETVRYPQPNELLDNKVEHSILWVGRFLDWKHPELALWAAKRLKAEGYAFSLDYIGGGPLEGEIRRRISEEGLEDCVHMLGSMPPGQVRSYMERSSIFLFTSDFQEGWGAVLNESMNSACAVVACSAIGSVPFMLADGENGFTYPNGDLESFYARIKSLLDSKELCRRIGLGAYQSVENAWNARTAAERFVQLATELLESGDLLPQESGPCSLSEII